MIFSRGLWLLCLNGEAWDGTSQCVLRPGQPCEARESDHALGQACALGPNDQFHHGIPLEESSYMQPTEPAGIGHLGIL